MTTRTADGAWVVEAQADRIRVTAAIASHPAGHRQPDLLVAP